ncbi:uncharacterized protein LOC116153640 [Camelus dromedarius]|uniref:uncharacterized protein LOC116153640 n=1 Tax=Camelus dromedarius TaxID=9838 RepID=UPI00311A80ED
MPVEQKPSQGTRPSSPAPVPLREQKAAHVSKLEAAPLRSGFTVAHKAALLRAEISLDALTRSTPARLTLAEPSTHRIQLSPQSRGSVDGPHPAVSLTQLTQEEAGVVLELPHKEAPRAPGVASSSGSPPTQLWGGLPTHRTGHCRASCSRWQRDVETAVVGNLPPLPQKEKRSGGHTNKEPNACSWWDGPQGELTAVVATQQSHAWSVLGPGGALGPAWRRTLEVGGPGRSLQADHLTGNHPLRAGTSDSNVTMTSVSCRRRLATPCTQREGPSEGVVKCGQGSQTLAGHAGDMETLRGPRQQTGHNQKPPEPGRQTTTRTSVDTRAACAGKAGASSPTKGWVRVTPTHPSTQPKPTGNAGSPPQSRPGPARVGTDSTQTDGGFCEGVCHRDIL